MTKYSEKAQHEVEKAMHEYKNGELHSGRAGKKVKDRRQAVAIGISKARKKHYKTPVSDS